jgi:hypothetical protein
MMADGGMMGGQGMASCKPMSGHQASPLETLDAAKQAFQGYVDRTGIQNLEVDHVMQFQWNYYASVSDTSTGSGAFELLADPHTGSVFPEIGPSMMWNTKYSPMAAHGGMMMGGAAGYAPGGMMSGIMGPTPPTVPPTVTAAQAQQIAQQWLDQNQRGSATETPVTFPGYYTVHFTQDGQISGMLSVNAYTGAVWYHTWHGAFGPSSQA